MLTAVAIEVMSPVRSTVMVSLDEAPIWKVIAAWVFGKSSIKKFFGKQPEKITTQKVGKNSFVNVINVSEGFEGPLDDNYHRGTLGGWRFHGLPWQQN